MLEGQAKPGGSGKRQRKVFRILSSGLGGLLLLLSVGSGQAEEWNKGGNLHQASVYRWLKASDANRLATSADWFMALTQKSNRALLEEMKAMVKEDYDQAFKYYATRLESCISEKLEKKTVRSEDKVFDYAEKCYKVLHGGDVPLEN